MKALKQALKDKDLHKSRSIVMASMRQGIITKSQFTSHLQECHEVFGNDFFDEDDNLTPGNNQKELFASLKSNFSHKKINQLLAILPDIPDRYQEETHHRYSSAGNSKKTAVIVGGAIIILIIILTLLAKGSNHDSKSQSQSSSNSHSNAHRG